MILATYPSCTCDGRPAKEMSPQWVCERCGDRLGMDLDGMLTEARAHGAAEERAKWESKYNVLRSALSDLAEGDCSYGDGCPAFGSRHGQCCSCKAREALSKVES